MTPSPEKIEPIFLGPAKIKFFVWGIYYPLAILLLRWIVVGLPFYRQQPRELAPLFAFAVILHATKVLTLKMIAKYIWIIGYPSSDLLRIHLTASLRNLYFTVIESREALYVPQRGAMIRIKNLIFLHRLHTDGAIDPVVWRQVTKEMLRMSDPNKNFSTFCERNEKPPYSQVCHFHKTTIPEKSADHPQA